MDHIACERFVERVIENYDAAAYREVMRCPWYTNNPWHIPVFPNLQRPAGLIQTEYEISLFLFSFVLMLKPLLVVETGTDTGTTAQMLGRACAANGFGRVITCDIEEEYVEHAQELCLNLPVEVRLGKALEVVPEIKECDLLFSDSSYDSRLQEVGLLKDGAYGVIHDTGIEPSIHNAIARFRRSIYFPTPRGLGLFQALPGLEDPWPDLNSAREYVGVPERLAEIAKLEHRG